MRRLLCFFIAMIASAAGAATFLVPSDETLVQASRAIVVATAGSSYSRYAPGGWIETVTALHVDEAIKGPIASGDTIAVTELGGTIGSISYIVPGSPQYASGERVLLFLETNDRGEWVSKNMVVGKFAFSGSHLVRDTSELFGWDAGSGMPHREPLRDAARFLRYVREVAAGRSAQADYIVSDRIESESLKPAPMAVDPATYLLQSGGRGFRWNQFPSAVTFLSHGTQPGALNGGLTSLQRALAAWSGAPGANIRYQYGGTTSISATHLCNGCGGTDGVNSVEFNDPSNEIPGSFQLQSGATLAIGGCWSSGSTHQAFGETFLTIVEADLVVQDGIDTGGGSVGLSGPGFDHVLTHELGHTLGLRHSDDPPPGGTTTTDAIMNSSVNFNNDTMGSTLQAWDIEAVDAVYGSGSVTPVCNAPVITAQPQSAATINTPVNLGVTATGDVPLQYQWFIGTSGNTSQPIGGANGAALTVQPAVTTQYWVSVTNMCASVNSTTATVTVNGCPPVVIDSISLSTLIIEGKSATLTASANGGSGISYQWFTGNPGSTTDPAGTGSSITVTPQVTTNYWLRATNGCGAFADSSVIVVTVQPCNPPVIRGQPSGGDVLSGTSIALFVADSGTQPESYQWYQGAAGDTSNPVPGASFPSFTTPQLSTSTSYWVRITNDCGTIDSQAAQLNVVSSCRTPAIVVQPSDVSVPEGSTATLSVSATGTSLLYQWYQGALLDFTRPVGGSSPTLITPPITGATQFWLRVTSPCGSPANSATINVTPAARRRPSRG